MKKRLLLVMSCVVVGFVVFNTVSAQTDITTKILQQIETNPSPRESLVQWYYSMDDFYANIAGLS